MILSHRRLRLVAGALVMLIAAGEAHAQTATLSGFVTDRSTGQPLELVSVALQRADGVARGDVSGPNGAYIITGIDPGRYILRASYLGYAAYTDTLVFAAGERRTHSIRLQPTDVDLEEVVVATDRSNGAANVTAGRQTIRPEDIELIPAPDLSADLVGYLTAMPGVVTTGDRGGQLFIRGGEPSQNLVLLDGMPVYQPFHVLGFYSAFPAEIINRADIYAGGFGARFGGRISSVLDITTRNGNERRFAGSATASPFVSSASLEGPIVPDQVSFLASVRVSTIEQGAERMLDEDLPFSFGDAYAKVQGRIGERGRIAISGLHTHDRGVIGEDTGGAPPDEVRWQNQAVGLRYVVLPKILPVTATLRVSDARLHEEQGPRAAPYRVSTVHTTTLALDASFSGQRVDVDAGWAIESFDINSELGGTFQGLALHQSEFTGASMYLEPNIDLGGGLRLQPSVRMQFYQVRFDPYVEPRLRAVWERGKHQISAAAGLYHQEVVGLSDRRDAASVFTVWTNIPRKTMRQQDLRAGRLAEAVHAILGYRVSPTPWLDLSIEGFHKDISNLFVAEWTAFPRLTTRLQPASGFSNGFDARVEFRPGRWYGFINYGYSNTIYKAEQASLKLWYGVEHMRYRPPQDRHHQLNALLSTRLAGFDVSARWSFGSGLPYSRAYGFDGFTIIEDIVEPSKVPTARRVIYERPYNGVLPTYHRLDLSLARTFDLHLARVTLQGSVINSYDRRNIFYLDVFTLQRVDQLPLVPSFGLKVEF
ncbi:MAG TPA: TonB-dependent receptor [Rhodothermales bacterium]|nr:TonB-dependent receptor [Rhodothermales bacterium]